MCMIFKFSSLCSCSRVSCRIALGKRCKDLVTRISGLVVVSHLWPRKLGIRPSAERRTSSHGWFQDYHRVQPQLHLRVSFRRIYLFWIKQKGEVTNGLRKTVAKELRETATRWCSRMAGGTLQRTSRSQKYLHPPRFLMTLIQTSC